MKRILPFFPFHVIFKVVNEMKKIALLSLILLLFSGCSILCKQKIITYQATNNTLELDAELSVDECKEDQLEITNIQYKDDILVTKVVVTLYEEKEVVAVINSNETEIEYEGKGENYEPVFELNEYLKPRKLLLTENKIDENKVSSYRLEIKITTTSNEEITIETNLEKREK